MISASQGGFRNKRTTAQQMEMMVMALEDAHLFKQDIYLLQADMTEAFDAIDHDKLLMIMYDLGFPTDAIEVVKDLYTNARTTFQTPYGPTATMALDRGTVQGDSLSPFLFIVYLEALLRWLKAGGKGYQFGALNSESHQTQEHYQLSDITYADDLNALTGGPTGLDDLKHQAAKISAYTTWGSLIVNNTKTTVTGALHGTQPQQPYDEQLLSTRLSSIKVQGRQLTFQSPRKPFRHLGLLLTMDLNYKHQLNAMLDKVRSQVNHLKMSYASPKQKMRVISTCVRPAITYAMTVAPYTLQEIRLLDSLLAKATKQAYGLSTSTSNDAVHQDIQHGGLGCPSLEVEHHILSTQRLVRALNDSGPLGGVSRALLKNQKTGIDVLTADKIPFVLNYSMRIRQVMAMKRAKLHLLHDGAPRDDMQDTNALAAALKHTLPEPDKWTTQLVQDLHALHSVGVPSLESMLTCDRTHVKPAQELRAIVGSRQVKPKHLRAWNRITQYLHEPNAPNGRSRSPSNNLDKKERALSQQVLSSLKDIWPANPNKRCANILHLLAEITERNAPAVRQARDQMAEQIHKMMSRNCKHLGADLRKAPKEPYNLKQSTSTGFAQYCQLMLKQPAGRTVKRDRWHQNLLELYTKHSHTPDEITQVTGLTMKHQQAGKGKKQHKTGRSQQQAMVTWAPSLQPGWLIHIAQVLGYEVLQTGHRLALCGDEAAAVQLQRPCEICQGPSAGSHMDTPNESLQCQVCQRRYHPQCLPRQDQSRQLQGASAAYTCNECTTGFSRQEQQQGAPTTASTLHPDLHIYHVEWAPRCEPLDVVEAVGTAAAKAQLGILLAHRTTKQQSSSANKAYKAAPAQSHTTNPNSYPSGQLYDITIGQSVRKQLVMHPLPINPHADIPPTGRREVTTRKIPCDSYCLIWCMGVLSVEFQQCVVILCGGGL
eukprot:gene4031-biopygen5750